MRGERSAARRFFGRARGTDLFAFGYGQSLHVLGPVDVGDEGSSATSRSLAGDRERVRSHGAGVERCECGSDSLCDSAQHAIASEASLVVVRVSSGSSG